MADLKPGDIVKGAEVTRVTEKTVYYTCSCGRPSSKGIGTWRNYVNLKSVKAITCKKCGRARIKPTWGDAGV